MAMRAKAIGMGGMGALAAGIAVLAASSAAAQSAQDAGSLLGAILGQSGTSSPATTAAPPPGVTRDEASGGLRLALGKAAERVVAQLGRPGGFADDPRVRIGLPGALGKLDGLFSALDRAGVGGGLSAKLNAAAEGAVGKALPLLKSAITRMTLTDALGVVTGGDTSATDYFRRTMGPDLQQAMTPVVAKSLSGVKAFQALDSFTARNSLIAGPFGARDLTGYVTGKASEAVFLCLGEQEREIRRNPLGTGSKLIAKIFGKG
ncbi:hypothetical protein AQZ52_16830 [Novosphingobium fuchskuhlense]|uniref:DUF4197 domain-containing protein n=1 Tax=Novosphingobium fuchskuhlense TaxID=1117702 RepID=A0A124JTR7_9SPHN|nr:DUF4197 domain-containing protein [Novosphingobium fuchskuhlense]KUR70475.1 hypothetical protein AQZ52_16830 [Novosphingobium fuchskuhlense]